jgi:hypothetical protein
VGGGTIKFKLCTTPPRFHRGLKKLEIAKLDGENSFVLGTSVQGVVRQAGSMRSFNACALFLAEFDYDGQFTAGLCLN